MKLPFLVDNPPRLVQLETRRYKTLLLCADYWLAIYSYLASYSVDTLSPFQRKTVRANKLGYLLLTDPIAIERVLATWYERNGDSSINNRSLASGAGIHTMNGAKPDILITHHQ